MSCRRCFWAIILIVAGCASLFDRRSDFERGLELYRNRQFTEAVKYFVAHYGKFPDSDSTLVYLLDCYTKLHSEPGQISVMEKMASREMLDASAYAHLTRLYRDNRRFDDLHAMLARLGPPMSDELDKRLALDRTLLAELICGATRQSVQTDPMVWCISKGYLPVSPDGILYETDTLTTGNVIILLDRLVEPVYPRNFYPLQKITTRSYLYLPYMRLVEMGILNLDPYVAPDHKASVIDAARALGRMKEKAYFDQTH